MLRERIQCNQVDSEDSVKVTNSSKKPTVSMFTVLLITFALLVSVAVNIYAFNSLLNQANKPIPSNRLLQQPSIAQVPQEQPSTSSPPQNSDDIQGGSNIQPVTPPAPKVPSPNQAAFNKIYGDASIGWPKSKNGEILPSGLGSDPHDLFKYLVILQHLADYPGINKIVEVGFGDHNVTGQILLNKDQKYTGYDVAEILKRPDTQNKKFIIIESIFDIHEEGDLLICKDVMQHLPRAAVEYFFDKILPNFKYALVMNDYTSNPGKTDASYGGWHAINPSAYTTLPHEQVFAINYQVNKRAFVFPKMPW